MKKSLLLVLSVSLFGVLSLISRSGGLGFVNNQIRTLSPVHPGQCANCHTGGGGTGAMIISVLDAFNNPVTNYTPNQTYTVAVGIQDPNALVGGFQVECLDNAINAKAGSFTAGPGTQVTTIGSYEVAEHNSPNAFANIPQVGNATGWTFSWTAPSTGGLSLTFYGTANAANGNGNTTGDDGFAATVSLVSLPVRFISSHIWTHGSRVDVTWKAEENAQTAKYLVERATQNRAFEDVGELAAVGNGKEASYRFSDHQAPIGQPLTYRIRQVDHSGEETFSKTMRILLSPEKQRLLSVYPNPAKAGQPVKIRYWAETATIVQVSWSTLDGKGTIEEGYLLPQGDNTVSLASPLTAGNFILQIDSPQGRDTRFVSIE